jgi:hypothetical protein
VHRGKNAARCSTLQANAAATPQIPTPVLLSLLLAVAVDSVPVRADSASYSTSALAQLVSEAAALNRRVPDGLGGYRAELESEISIGNRRSERMEMAVSIEQVASVLTWDRAGNYEQVVKGYRSQSIGTSFSTLGFFRNGWAIPSLYGNRLALLIGRDTTETTRARRARRENDELYAVHPLAEDREQYYRFTGGDTIFTLQADGREIPIVRIEVLLRPDVPDRSVVFLGEIDLDATRRHIVRLRGFFAIVGGPKPRFDILSEARLQGIAYVEAVNAEVDGSYWLPSYQRFEAHATSNAVGESRAIFRILTRYRQREVFPPPPDLVVGAPGDTLSVRAFRLSVESTDTLSAFRDWERDIGAASSEVTAEDFNDVAPDQWRADGPPRFSLETERLLDVFRVDRVQGVFTGIGGVMRFRDAAPGFSVRAAAGYAWSERAARGRLVLEQRGPRTTVAVRAVRSLDLTNDFRNPYDSGSTTGALFGRDEYDYVDRWSLGLHVQRFLGDRQRGLVRLESGFAEDRSTAARLEESPIGWGAPFRENRPITAGRYARNVLTYEWRPDVSLEFLRPGVGARLSYERGDGELTYQRLEGRFTIRTNQGPFVLGARLDAGIASPNAPPQQFFELGRNQNLPGYGYKEFAGDQAAVLRGQALWQFGVWGAPLRLSRRFWLPPPAPAIALGAQAGWTRATSAAAASTVTLLGSQETERVRASGSLTLRFFGGAVGIGAARPLDYPGKWRWLLEFGQRL